MFRYVTESFSYLTTSSAFVGASLKLAEVSFVSHWNGLWKKTVASRGCSSQSVCTYLTTSSSSARLRCEKSNRPEESYWPRLDSAAPIYLSRYLSGHTKTKEAQGVVELVRGLGISAKSDVQLRREVAKCCEKRNDDYLLSFLQVTSSRRRRRQLRSAASRSNASASRFCASLCDGY